MNAIDHLFIVLMAVGFVAGLIVGVLIGVAATAWLFTLTKFRESA